MRNNLTSTECIDIYNHLQELVDLASDINSSIYAGFTYGFNPEDRIGTIRAYLEQTYQLRFVQFKPEKEFITDLSYPEQWMFALFVSEMILHGELPE